MHMVIRVVVEAHDIESAVSQAELFFNNHLHVDQGGIFDYCTPMVEGFGVAGSDRWVDYENEESAFPLGSESGRNEVKEAWESTQKEIRSNLEVAWNVAQESEDFDEFVRDVMNDENLVRHKMSNASGYTSNCHYLYVRGWNTGGIRSPRGWEYTKELMDEAKESQDVDGDEVNGYWVVPLDVHY